eukprot:7378985-Prymnesium_polylepis.1
MWKVPGCPWGGWGRATGGIRANIIGSRAATLREIVRFVTNHKTSSSSNADTHVHAFQFRRFQVLLGGNTLAHRYTAPYGDGTVVRSVIRDVELTHQCEQDRRPAVQRGPGSAVSNHAAAPRSAPSLARASETLRTVDLDDKLLSDALTSKSITFYEEFLHVIVCTRIVCRLHAARQKRNPARDGGAPTQGEVLKNTRISQLSLDARTQGAASGRGHVRRSGAAAAVAAISASRPLKKMAVAPYTACGAPEGRGCEEAISRLLAPLRASASRLLRGNGRAARAQVRAVPPK